MHVQTGGGAVIPAIGLGTWPLKGAACRDAVRTALEAGYRHIDTAAMYDNEAAVGEGIRASGLPREAVFVTTKVWTDRLRDGDLQRSALQSVERIGLGPVDLLLVHWPNPSVPLEETIGALNDAWERGLTRYIGVSNFDAALLREAQALSAAPLVADQVQYHPGVDRSALLDECRKEGVAFVSYTPLARRAVLADAGIRRIAAEKGKTPAQIVLRWHIEQGCVAIPKSADPARIRENIDVFDFSLTPEEMAVVSAAR